MVSLTPQLRIIIRPLVVTSIIVLFFVFLFNLNFSSYRSIPNFSNLFDKTNRVLGTYTLKNMNKIKLIGGEISQLLITSSVPHQSPKVVKKTKELCPLVSPKLIGWTNISTDMKEALLKEDEIKVELKMKAAGLKFGGRYEPIECQSRHKVAIVVPYRERKDHLTVFLRYLHPFLQRQQLNYIIIVVEQSENFPFNRGMLMNIGFHEVQLQEKFQCFIFHDVDLLPEDDHNPYTCPEDGKPRQMAFSIDHLHNYENYTPTPRNHFGGVTTVSTNDFQALNGYSNIFWGWGSEDDQLYKRVKFNNMTVVRAFDEQPSLIHLARYKTLPHKKAIPNPDRNRLFKQASSEYKTDGLSSLEYKRLYLQLKHLYTHVLVDIH